jgi:tetratricopeptide (TPR) repeat protein
VLVELPPRARPDAPSHPRARLTAWLVALFVLIPHLRGIAGGFVYDDFRFVAENPGVQTFAEPAGLVASIDRMAQPVDRDIWRPLRTALFAAEWRLFGGHPAGFHVVSLLLFLLVVRMVVALALRLPGVGLPHAAAAGLLFGAHPLTVECVAWISSQGDLLAAAFVLAALLTAARRPWLSLVLAALALLGKESALPLAAVLWLAARWWKEGARPRAALAAGVLVLTAVYLVARQHVLARDWSLGGHGLGQVDAPLGQRLLQFAQSSSLALKLMVWPRPLAIAYDDDYLRPPAALDLLFAALKFGIVALALLRTPATRIRTRFALAAALLFFLPTSGLAVAMKVPLAERFLLLPLAGVAVAVAAALPLAHAPVALVRSALVRSARGAVAAAALALGAATFVRTGDFRDDATLWRAELAVHPSSLQAQLGMVQAAHDANDAAAERRWAQSIVDAAPPADARRIFALATLGELASDAHDEGAALIAYERCRAEVNARRSVESLYPGIHRAWVALGDAARKREGPAAAEAILKEGFGWFGPQPALLAGLGLCRLEADDAAGAERLFREAVAREPANAQNHQLLARALAKLGRREEARAEFARALSMDPSDGTSRRMLDELSR